WIQTSPCRLEETYCGSCMYKAIHNSMLCTAKTLRKQLRVTVKIMYISCLQKKRQPKRSQRFAVRKQCKQQIDLVKNSVMICQSQIQLKVSQSSCLKICFKLKKATLLY